MSTESAPRHKLAYLLDTSALLAYLGNEKGAHLVARLKSESCIPFIAYSELYYITWARKGKSQADTVFGLVKSWRLPMMLPNERVIINAGRFKACYKMGYADSYIAAFALDGDMTLVAKDEDYNKLKEEIKILQIHR